jgi:hypothetical protein
METWKQITRSKKWQLLNNTSKNLRNRSRTDFNGKDTTRKKMLESLFICESNQQTNSLMNNKLRINIVGLFA